VINCAEISRQINLRVGFLPLSLEDHIIFSQFLSQRGLISRVMFDYGNNSTLLFFRHNENPDPDGKHIDCRVTIPGFQQRYKNNQAIIGQDLGEIEEIIYYKME
jgi:hypothetical protein